MPVLANNINFYTNPLKPSNRGLFCDKKSSLKQKSQINKFAMKYGKEEVCNFCGSTFITRPRFLKFCSQSCKNPNNRPGNIPWNKGRKGRQPNHNTSGLNKGHGWNKGIANPELSKRMTGENNPNWNGKVNRVRYKDHVPNSDYLEYKRKVNKYTGRTVTNILEPHGLVPDNVGRHSDQYQCDHIIPIKQGFEEGICPELLSQPANLQYLLGEDNRRKWDEYQPCDVKNNILEKCKNGLQRTRY